MRPNLMWQYLIDKYYNFKSREWVYIPPTLRLDYERNIMKYMGSKARIAKHILPIILKDRKEGQCYVEPFVGGANMIDKVDGWRVGADSNYWLISALDAISKGWNPPELITESDYSRIKHDNSSYKPELVGYVGFQMSFGGKWFGGYMRDVKGTQGCIDNMKTQSRRSRDSALKQGEKIDGVKFYNCSYLDLSPPSESIIYCDPPYANTTKYKDDFDHEQFWQWCRDKVKEGHEVFISEYNAPDDFVCVWQKEIQSGLNTNTTKKGVEKLFIHESQYGE